MSNYPGVFCNTKADLACTHATGLGMFSQGQSFWTESETGETTLLQPKGGCRVGMREEGGYHSSHQQSCVCFPPGDTTQGKPHKMPQLRGNACAHSQMAKINHAQGQIHRRPGLHLFQHSRNWWLFALNMYYLHIIAVNIPLITPSIW